MEDYRHIYEEEVRSFLKSGALLVTGNLNDTMSMRQMQFLYNKYTGEHRKKFMKVDSMASIMEKIISVDITGQFEGVASADPGYFEKGKKEIQRWLDFYAGKEIPIPEKLFYVQNKTNALIGAYNKWETGNCQSGAPVLFKFIPEIGEPQYWNFKKAVEEMGYRLVDRWEECEGHTVKRLGIYDKEGRNLANTFDNIYADYVKEDILQ